MALGALGVLSVLRMSVSDLVTEVEQALVEGERLDQVGGLGAGAMLEPCCRGVPGLCQSETGGGSWRELNCAEAQSVRLENDALHEKVAELEARCL